MLEEVISKQFVICSELLSQKAKEYAPVDRLHNFRVAAEMQNVRLETALAGMMAKHTVSLYDLIERTQKGEVFGSDIWVEKITDHMNYLLLLKAILVEEWDKPTITVNTITERDVAYHG
jgi:hypothetical protein